jgi:hypothetical protein
MKSETVASVVPYLELDNQQIPQKTERFTEVLAAFLADQSDPTGLKVSNLRLIVQSLKTQYERIDSMLARLEQQDN